MIVLWATVGVIGLSLAPYAILKGCDIKRYVDFDKFLQDNCVDFDEFLHECKTEGL